MESHVSYYSSLGVILLAFSILILILNSVLFKVILRSKPNSSFEILLLGIASIDIFKALVPFGLSSIKLLKRERFQEDSVACYISGWSFTTYFISSSVTLLIMAVERCITLLRRGPYAFPCRPLKLKIILAMSYIFVAVFGLLPLLQFGRIIPSENRSHCHFEFTDRSNQGRAYSILILIWGWSTNLVTFVCILITYNTISSNPRMIDSKATFGQDTDPRTMTDYQNIFSRVESPKVFTSTGVENMGELADFRKIKPGSSIWRWKLSNPDYCLEKCYFLLTVALILSFSISWIPLMGYLTIAQIQTENLPKLLFMISVCTSVLNSVFNPLISIVLYNRYRKIVAEYIQRMLPRCLPICKYKSSLGDYGDTPSNLQDLDNSRLPWPSSLGLTFHNYPTPEGLNNNKTRRKKNRKSGRFYEIRNSSNTGNRPNKREKILSNSTVFSNSDSFVGEGKKEMFKDDLRYQVLRRTSSTAYVVGLTSTPRRKNSRSVRESEGSISTTDFSDLSYNSYNKFASMGNQDGCQGSGKGGMVEVMEAYV